MICYAHITKKNTIQWRENILCCQKEEISVSWYFFMQIEWASEHTFTHANCHIDKNSCFHNSVKSNQSTKQKKNTHTHQATNEREQHSSNRIEKKRRTCVLCEEKKNKNKKNWLKERTTSCAYVCYIKPVVKQECVCY